MPILSLMLVDHDVETVLFLLQVLDRGEKIELLVDKTENLRSQVSSEHLRCVHQCLNSM